MVLTAIGGFLGLAVGELFSLLVNKYSPLPAYVPAWAIGDWRGHFSRSRNRFRTLAGMESGAPRSD